MKKTISLLAGILAFSASAAQIRSGQIYQKDSGDEIELRVFYGGGLCAHSFSLALDQSDNNTFNLVEDTKGDTGEAFIGETLIFKVNDLPLSKAIKSGDQITIQGDNDTSVTLTIP
jgi:hypothetical protein